MIPTISCGLCFLKVLLYWQWLYVGILIFCLLRNVKRKEVFTKENSTLIVAIGGIVELNGLLQGFFGTFVSVSNLRQTYLIYILLGVFILFIGCVFKIGVRMKEEQELTI